MAGGVRGRHPAGKSVIACAREKSGGGAPGFFTWRALLRTAAALVLVALLAVPGFAAQHKSSRHVAAKPAHTAAAAKSGVRSTHRRGRSKAARTARGAKSRQTWRTGQMAPAPERYKEIEEALVARGYSSQAPDGIWGPQWADSLKRFQQDQKLEPTGKLNSLSLITLGLGPRREPALAAPVANGFGCPGFWLPSVIEDNAIQPASFAITGEDLCAFASRRKAIDETKLARRKRRAPFKPAPSSQLRWPQVK
jgi:hypothetical protein